MATRETIARTAFILDDVSVVAGRLGLEKLSELLMLDLLWLGEVEIEKETMRDVRGLNS